MKNRLTRSSFDPLIHACDTFSQSTHHAELTPSGSFARPDEWLTQADEPDHDELCRREQEFFVHAIREQLDLTSHLEDSLASLSIVLAADQAMRTGQSVDLSGCDFSLHPVGA